MGNHWSSISSDPNDIEVRKVRAERISRAIDWSPVDRIDFIRRAVRGKRVLDIGCVAHFSASEKDDIWLHKHLAESASYCLGVDILEGDVQNLKAEGYNVICHNLIEGPLGDLFDIIVCGEVIEHIENFGGFLENCKASLADAGLLVVTTPYPWFLGSVIRNLIKHPFATGSVDHVSWQEPATLVELAERHGMKVTKVVGLIPEKNQRGSSATELFYDVVRKGWLPRVSTFCGCRSLLYLLEHDDIT